MQELGIDLAEVQKFFVEESDDPFLLINVPNGATPAWAEMLGVPARRCYIADDRLAENAERTNRPRGEIVAAKLPDPGAVMAGDFGEILAALFLASREHPAVVRDPKKWRLKQDRAKAAPYSDVVQFLLPDWPTPSSEDRLVCAEVKTKSTSGGSKPVASAIADSVRDREGRLVKTLAWLKERSLGEELGTVDLQQIDRFIEAIDHPPAAREFRAVAVICSSLVATEIDGVEAPQDGATTLVVISVPDLKVNYEGVYAAIAAQAEPGVV